MKIPTSFITLLGALTLTANLSAATKTWDGSSSGFWTNSANWSGSVAPVNGDMLVFPTGPTRLSTTNTAGGATNFTAIVFTGADYVVRSSSLSITNGLTNAAPINAIITLNAPLAPRASQTWESAGKTTLVLNSNVAYGTFTLTLDAIGLVEANGNFVGGASGDLTKLGAGRLEMNGAANLLDQVRIGDGTLEVAGVLAANSLTISNGATLAGAGTGSVFTCAGDLRPGGIGGTALGVLTISGAGASVFQPGGRLQTTLHSPTPGTGYDQLKVSAVPNLAHGSLSVLRDAAFPLTLGQKFVIITNTAAGALTTTFTNLPQGAFITNALPPTTIFQISYTGGSGNDVELTVVDMAVTPTGVTRVWDGGGGSGNRSWNTPVNWGGNTLPNRGDDLVFPASVPANIRILNNNLPVTNAVFNRLWFGGNGNSWIIQGNALKLLGGVVATNEFPLGDASFGNTSVELMESQTWSGTNMGITVNAPLLLGGHTLTLASAVTGQVRLQDEVLGPGTLVAVNGEVSFFSQVGASNVTVTIQGADVFAGFGPFTGPAWQMSGGTLRPGNAQIPGLQATGGVLDLSGLTIATIAGNLTLAPACTVVARFDTQSGQPLIITGQVNLNGARLDAGPADFALLGTTLVVLSNAGPSAVTGTFAGLPEAALFTATNEVNGLVTLYQISYVGGNGNDVTLTPLLPNATGVTRVWTGAGANPLWETVANWTGNTPPVTGDDVRFPVNAAQGVNTNAAPGLVLNSIAWDGSNYLHSGTFSLLNGLSHGAAGGTNFIAVAPLLAVLGSQTWAVSNAAATLRVFQAGDSDAGIDGVGLVTKSGAGTLELEGVEFGVSGGLIINGGTTRLTSVAFNKDVPLVLQQGRVEALGVGANNVTATNGELALLFGPGEEGLFGGLFSSSSVALGSNLTLTVHWTNGAFVAIQAAGIKLDDARLNLTFPPALAAGEIIRVAQYFTDELTGTFANLADGAVTNFGGRAWQIHYDVELPNEDPSRRFITLVAPVVAPNFTSLERLGNGDVILRGTAGVGAAVFIEATQDFASWTDLGSTLVNGAGNFTFLDSTGLPFRFYRARLPGPGQPASTPNISTK